MDNLYIIIPAYNEEENIEFVAKQWHEIVSTVIRGRGIIRSLLLLMMEVKIIHIISYVS